MYLIFTVNHLVILINRGKGKAPKQQSSDNKSIQNESRVNTRQEPQSEDQTNDNQPSASIEQKLAEYDNIH